MKDTKRDTLFAKAETLRLVYQLIGRKCMVFFCLHIAHIETNRRTEDRRLRALDLSDGGDSAAAVIATAAVYRCKCSRIVMA